MRHPERLAAVVFLVDAILARFKPGLLVAGLVDESAHVATTLLFGAAFPDQRNRAFVIGALAGSVLIDADHVPPLLLKLPLESAEDRPFTHSLVTLAALAAIGGTRRGTSRSIMLGVATGTTFHFVRDLATGGVPLFWPVTRRLQHTPYAVYAALIAGYAVRARLENQRPVIIDRFGRVCERPVPAVQCSKGSFPAVVASVMFNEPTP